MKTELTKRQLRAIPHIVRAKTYSEGIKNAGIGRTTFYEWLKQPEFKAELDRQRHQLADEAFAVLEQNLRRAVEALIGLVDTKDNRLRRLACKDIIDHVLKFRELKDLEERLKAIEEKLQVYYK